MNNFDLALKIYLAGLAILFGAAIINFLAKHFRLLTWYDFLNSLARTGLKNAWGELNALSIIFLFLLYPLLLGLIWYGLRKLFG